MSECLKYKTPNGDCMGYAIASHNIDFVTFLMNEYNIKTSLYYYSILYKNLEAFLVYFDQTNNVDECLYNSVRFGIPSFCEYFLSHGANVNAGNTYGETALHFAAGYNYKEIAEPLISYGANINSKDGFGRIALHNVARENSVEIAELLISHGANINEKNNDGKTALHCTAMYNYKEIVELLISHGANINEKTIMEIQLFIIQQCITIKK
ncbi:ankyrin repeat protein, putative [Trichomonas vaginalis G3]|uniref:Ankyrin repeat protein, putative n=1 Tax=Trichomonas vaginalis (strain ATCC PRA-98 / G3) TaxID=412133 RepID=A2DMV4_TRIV3|nr:protein ubiquitination [Trichomonas vaginalis G3]EAY18325.1 ankyrin repeat protein, putative [Trichomonas vaginalis G3]KAI5541853.1 protein ubiquitination [Trichomonas vaginalis G3]|eukprot:XP_001579311.1 ankyrin repeat protein [Trichomonas vaginalis G3]